MVRHKHRWFSRPWSIRTLSGCIIAGDLIPLLFYFKFNNLKSMSNTFWKIILCVYSVLIIGYSFSVIFSPVYFDESFNLKYLSVIPLYIFSAFILYLRAFDKKILRKIFWKTSFVLFVLLELVLLYFSLEGNLLLQVFVLIAFWEYLKKF